MTNYLITEQDFKNFINWRQMIRESGCKVLPRSGNYSGTSGHEDCGSCPGNYYNGGECNYGGHHVLANEVTRINQNFEGIDVLGTNHEKLKISASTSQSDFNNHKNTLLNNFQKVKTNCTDPSRFVYASCVGVHNQSPKFLEEVKRRFQQFVRGIDRYIGQIQNLTWHQVEEFQQKLKEIKELKEENTKLAEQIKNTDDPTEKARLIAILKGNKDKINNLIQELNKHPARSLFDPQTSDILRNAKRNLFRNHSGNDPWSNLGKSKGSGDWGGKGSTNFSGTNKSSQDNQNPEESFLSSQNKKILQQIGIGILIIGALGIAYAVLKSKLKGA